MVSAFSRQGFDGDRARFRRALTLLLAIAIEAGLLIMLLLSAPSFDPKKEQARMPVTFSLAPQAKEASGKKKTVEKQSEAKSDPAPSPVPAPPAPATPAKAPKETPPLPFLQMGREAMASANIGNMPSKSNGGGSGTGKESASAQGPGEGPGGEQLYEAEWYRRPTNAELATYMPANPPPNGWGLVACKTIEHYHVENCQSLGESPMGSGFARAVRQAAWQFLVRPPRIGGRPEVGAWVRIRIDYYQGVAQEH